MKRQIISFSLIPLLIFMSGCGTYYEASHFHGYPASHNHVSVGVHGHVSSRNAAAVVGALVVGGIIGAAINEAENQNREAAIARQKQQQAQQSALTQDDADPISDGYTIENPASQTRNPGQIWYQQGQDGHCYLMQATESEDQVIQAVPDKRCRK